MRLTPAERDRLLLFTTAELARARRSRGLGLNVPEATALVADTVAEAARDGMRLADAVAAGRSVLSVGDVLPGVPDVVTEVQVEAVFDDGTRLAVVTDPFGAGTVPGPPGGPTGGVVTEPASGGVRPGAVLTGEDERVPAYDEVVEVAVTNTAAVPISVTSHFHFFEVNPRLWFDRATGYGRHLAVPAGTAQRFDPGTTVEVRLVPIGGERVVVGYAGLVDGPLDEPGMREAALERARACGYLGAEGDG